MKEGGVSVSAFEELWRKLAKSKAYREEFVAAQLKRGIPFQIRALMKKKGFSQEKLAKLSNLTQGVISRAANPNYGNLTLNTIIRIAAGFDVAFTGKFVPFSELGRWFVDLSEDSVQVPSFDKDVPMGGALRTALAAPVRSAEGAISLHDYLAARASRESQRVVPDPRPELGQGQANPLFMMARMQTDEFGSNNCRQNHTAYTGS